MRAALGGGRLSSLAPVVVVSGVAEPYAPALLHRMEHPDEDQSQCGKLPPHDTFQEATTKAAKEISSEEGPSELTPQERASRGTGTQETQRVGGAP